MKQQSLSDIEYANRRRKTKREAFLDSMNEIIPWNQWIEIIRPYYYSNKRGRRPKDIEGVAEEHEDAEEMKVPVLDLISEVFLVNK